MDAKNFDNLFFFEGTYTDKHLERFFIFAVMWSLGAVLELDDRAKLEQYAVKSSGKMDWPKCGEGESIFEYVVGDNGKWQHWSERVVMFEYPEESVLEYTSILVPNVDNMRTAFLIEIIARQGKAVLLIGTYKRFGLMRGRINSKMTFLGEQGTAKTVMIKGYLNTFDPDYKISKSFNFSSATTPNMVQVMI